MDRTTSFGEDGVEINNPSSQKFRLAMRLTCAVLFVIKMNAELIERLKC